MRFENNEYDIIDEVFEDGVECICISKTALERLRDHYLKVADGSKKEPMKWGLYLGKADVLIDILKHFEEEEV